MSRGSRSCVPAVVNRIPPRTALPPHILSNQWREGLRCSGCAQSPNSAACECRLSRTWLQRTLCNAIAASASDTRSETAAMRLGVSRVGLPPVRWVLYPAEQPQCCGCGVTHTANYRGCVKCKEPRAALPKQAPQRATKYAATGHSAAPRAQQAGPSAEQLALGEGATSLERGVLPRLLPPLHPVIQIPLLSWSRRCPGSL